MDKLIYSLCGLTSLTCAVLLLRAFWRTRFRLLLWSGLCFAGFTANNVLLLLDKLVFTDVDLVLWRLTLSLLSLMVLLMALVLEDQR